MKDGWLCAAMLDDNIVADLLIRLHQSDPHPSSFLRQTGVSVSSLPPFDWGTRHPRSISSAGKKDRERTRRSPTTPLSWSAGGVGSASPSDGYEDSSKLSDRFRSKGSAANETTTSTTTGCKRPRKKKTFAELKEEESGLLKERTHLKKELDSLRIRLEEQRSLNVNYKRIKLDLSEQKSVQTLKMFDQQQAKSEHASDSHGSCPAQYEMSNEQPSFVLPDLNMTPEEDCTLGKAVRMS